MSKNYQIGDRVSVVGVASGSRYPGRVSGLSSSVVLVRFDKPGKDAMDASFLRETGQSTGPIKLLRLDMGPVRAVRYHTFGPDGEGALAFETLEEAKRLCRTPNGLTEYGVLKFTEEDDKIVDIEVAYVRK